LVPVKRTDGLRKRRSRYNQAVLRHLVFVVLIGLIATSAATAGGARVRVMNTSPATVRGTGFVPGERVRVTVDAGAAVTRRVLAGTAGGFVARFRTITLSWCTAYVVRAVGSSGDTAIVRVRAPECPQPPTP
jgi:hypothetical protein